MYITILSLLVFFCILFFILFYVFTSQLEKYQNTFLINFYESSFYRKPDPVTLLYYSNMSISQMNHELDQYKRKVEKGKQLATHQHIILTGLIRNSSGNIGFLEHFFNELRTYFASIQLLIVENNSEDTTREQLLKWTFQDSRVQLLCPFHMDQINHRKCQINDYDSPLTHGVSRDRIYRLSHLRNFYLDYIRANMSWENYHYLFVMDFDLNGELPMDGIFHTLWEFSNQPTISGIACNGIVIDQLSITRPFRYYDSFAHIDQGDPITWDNTFDKQSHDMEVLQNITDRYSKSMKLDHVTSAFGGFCIYNIAHIYEKNARYSYTSFPSGRFSCEHSHFHVQLGSMFVNPRMVFHINYV